MTEEVKTYCSDVGVVYPRFHNSGTNRVGNDYGVLIAIGHSSDQVFSVLPQGEVLAVTLVTVDLNVLFTGVRIDEHKLQKWLNQLMQK